MSNKSIVVFEKMLKYCDDAVKYSANRSYDEFVHNELHLIFSVFALSQLGELASKVDRSICARYPQIPWQAMRGIRNHIVHDYDGVQFKTLWDVLTKNIPELRIQLKQVIIALTGE